MRATFRNIALKFGQYRNRIAQSRFYKLIRGPVAGALFALALAISFIACMSLLSPGTTPSDLLAVLRAIIDVSGVLIGLSGIMFANITLAVSQQLWAGTFLSVSREDLRKYRRSLLNSMFSVFVFLMGSIASSLGYMTRVPEQTGGPLETSWFVWLPLYLLLAGIATMMITMREEPSRE
jgi:uncharacterized membrane protein YozB (DUF420 family)